MKIPEFKYHPDPIKTGAFSQGEYGQIEKNYDQNLNGFDIKDVKECMYNEGGMQGYLFRCLHCGEHFLYVDCD